MNGPEKIAGNAKAATVSPATVGEPPRSRISRTTPIANISSASRATVAAARNCGYPCDRLSVVIAARSIRPTLVVEECVHVRAALVRELRYCHHAVVVV